MFAFANSVSILALFCCLGLLALLLIFLSRVFYQHVSLEVGRCDAHVVAVSTGKRLLTSVRSHVSF